MEMPQRTAVLMRPRWGVAEQVEGCYEMSVGNADKGLMPAEEVKRRVQPFIDENLPLVLTQVSPAHCWQHRCLLPVACCC